MNYSDITQSIKWRDNCVSEALDILTDEVAHKLPASMHHLDILPVLVDEILGHIYNELQQAPRALYNLRELSDIIEGKNALELPVLEYGPYEKEEVGFFLESCASCIEGSFSSSEVYGLYNGQELHKLFDAIIKIAEEYKENAEPIE